MSQSEHVTKGRLLAFRRGNICLDSILKWAARERPDVLFRWGQVPASEESSAVEAPGACSRHIP